MPSLIRKICYGWESVWQSAGAFTSPETRLGLLKRTLVGTIKTADLLLVPARPDGTYLQGCRIELLKMLDPIVLEALSASEGKRPFIIGIGGGAATGKSVLANILKAILQRKGKKIFILRIDDFIKSREERASLGTEWDERHVNVAEIQRVLSEIKNGKTIISKPKNDRRTLSIETETIDISDVDILIFEGAYAISDHIGGFLKFLNLSVYVAVELEVERERRLWQEENKPHPRTKEQAIRNWEKGIVPDLKKNVFPSQKNARFIVHTGRHFHYQVETQQPR